MADMRIKAQEFVAEVIGKVDGRAEIEDAVQILEWADMEQGMTAEELADMDCEPIPADLIAWARSIVG